MWGWDSPQHAAPQQGNIDEAQSIKINATAHMLTGSRHVASSIDYAIEPTTAGGTKKYGFFSINTLDPSLSAGGDLGALWALFT